MPWKTKSFLGPRHKITHSVSNPAEAFNSGVSVMRD